MGLSLIPLLVADDRLPEAARAALQASLHAPEGPARDASRREAASVLHQQLDVPCNDLRELIGDSWNCS